MRIKRLNAIAAVRANIQDMEAAADSAAVALFSGIANMILHRQEAGLPFAIGSDELVRLSDAAAAQLRTNADLAAIHRALAVIPAQIGITSYGDVVPCEPDEQLRRHRGADLKVVTA